MARKKVHWSWFAWGAWVAVLAGLAYSVGGDVVSTRFAVAPVPLASYPPTTQRVRFLETEVDSLREYNHELYAALEELDPNHPALQKTP